MGKRTLRSWRDAILLRDDTLFNGANHGLRRDLFLPHNPKDGHADLFHVLGEVDGKLFPAVANIATEFASFVFRVLWRLMPAFLNKLPYLVNLVVGVLLISVLDASLLA